MRVWINVVAGIQSDAIAEWSAVLNVRLQIGERGSNFLEFLQLI